MNAPSSSFVLYQPFERSYQAAAAFLAVAKDKEQISRPLGFSLVKLIGNYFQIIEIVECIALPLERERVINFILGWFEKTPFDYLAIDQENYLLLNSDRKWNDITRIRSLNTGLKYPSLYTVIRNSDPSIRQLDSLNQLINDGRIQTAKSLNFSLDRSVVSVPAPDMDALAGATDQIVRIQKRILSQVADEQQRMKQANGRSIY